MGPPGMGNRQQVQLPPELKNMMDMGRAMVTNEVAVSYNESLKPLTTLLVQMFQKLQSLEKENAELKKNRAQRRAEAKAAKKVKPVKVAK